MNVSSFSISFQRQAHLVLRSIAAISHKRGLVDDASWMSQVPMKATWLPLNTLFHAPNTVWVSKAAHVFLIVFYFSEPRPILKAFFYLLGAFGAFEDPRVSSKPDVFMRLKVNRPICPPEVALPSGFRKLGHVLLVQRELAVNLSHVAPQNTIMKRQPLKGGKTHLWCGLQFILPTYADQEIISLLPFMEHPLCARCFISIVFNTHKNHM